MASTALLGFLKGSSGAALDSMELREKEAAERRKLEMAARIDHEYFSKRELFKEGLPSNVQARKERQRKMEMEEELHPLKVEGAQVGLDAARQDLEFGASREARADRLADAQIDNYRASASASRARASSLDTSGKSGVGAATIGASLVNSYKDTVDDLVKTAGVPRNVVEDTASRVVANVRANNPDASPGQLMEQARRQFVHAMSVLRQGTAPAVDTLPDGSTSPKLGDNGQPIFDPWNPRIVIDSYKARRSLGG